YSADGRAGHMGKRSAVVELFLGDMGSMQRELRPSTQREDQLTMETKLEQIAVKARREPNLRFTSLAHHITRPGAGEFIKDSEAIPRRARRNPRPYRDRTGRSPLWGADQLRSGSPARTRSRRSIQHSRSYSARSMSAATRCS